MPRSLLHAVILASIRHRFAVLGLATIVSALGVLGLLHAPYDVFPDFAPPRAAIQTEAPGLGPDQVELLVTQPIESAVLGVPGLVSVRSTSIQGLSDIVATFAPGSDLFRARQQVAEALSGVREHLPDAIPAPSLTPLTSSTGLVLIAGVSSPVKNLIELRTIAEWTIRPRLLAVPGVAKVSIYGGATKTYQVELDPARLARYGLAVSDLTTALRGTLGVRGAGFIETGNQRIVLTAGASEASIERIAGAIVGESPSGPVTLDQVAEVLIAPAPAIGGALIDGQPGIQLVVSAQYGANTVRVSHAVEHVLGELRPDLATEGVELRGDIFRPAQFIATALGNLEQALWVGGLLVVIVVVLFLMNVRSAIIALVAIPLSLLAAVALLDQLGMSLNTMTLGGLGIAVGLLVDDAVIVVENIHRRLRLARPDPSEAIPRVIAEATYEVRSAVLYATLAIALVFLPVITIPDVAGRLFGPLGVAYLLATLASLAVAVTVTPALCSLLISSQGLHEREPPLVRWLLPRYRALLEAVERRSSMVLAAVVGIAAGILSVVPSIGTSYIPEIKEGHYVIQMTLAPGTSLGESLRIGAHVAGRLREIDGVRLVAQRAGRSEKADDVFGVQYSEIEVDLTPSTAARQERSAALIRAALADIPGVDFAVRTFLSDRLDEVVSGYTAPVVIQAIGANLDDLDAAARQIAEAVRAIPGATEVQMRNPPGVPELDIRLKPGALRLARLNMVPVLEAVRTAYGTESVGQVYEGRRVFDVTVGLSREARQRPEELGALLVKTSNARHLPLSELAEIRAASGRYAVLHDGGRRVQVVTSAYSGEDLGAFAATVQARVRALQLPGKVELAFSGAAASQSAAAGTLLIHSSLAAVAMTLLLSLAIPRLRNLLLVFANLPFALIGGVLVLYLTIGNASLGALVGFVTLFGITLRNGIMLLAHYDHLTTAEGRPWTLATLFDGAADRATPILMTTLATALGLLPLAIGSGEAGREIEGPMAIVILGGLASSAILTLLVLPCLVWRLGRFEGRMTLPDAAAG